MPELPEVETMVLGLRSVMLGRAIEGIDIYEKKALNNTPPRLLVPLKGCLIIGLTRKGKFLFLHLSDGTQLLFHLKMTGRLVLRPRETPPERWERLSFTFRGWDQRLSFDDQRKFGYMAVHPGGCECPVPLVYELGPDALQVSLEVLGDTLAFSDRPVKSLLLDQRSIAGLGNIYVDECLYRAGIHPLTPSSRIPPVKVERLHEAISAILEEAIACGGSSVRNFRDHRGEEGTYQRHHRVYGKKGEDCSLCGSKIAYSRVASRGTHYCPVCQRLDGEAVIRKRAKKG